MSPALSRPFRSRTLSLFLCTGYVPYRVQPRAPCILEPSLILQRDAKREQGAGNVNDTSFLVNITTLIKDGLNITQVLGFNQPDLTWSEGGSNLSNADAAQLWINNFLPLQELGVKIGLPVVNAQRDPGNWTVPFLDSCTALIRDQTGDDTKDCPYDFVPIHAFGNMSVLTDRVETFSKT
jgi:hypothetical protein